VRKKEETFDDERGLNHFIFSPLLVVLMGPQGLLAVLFVILGPEASKNG